METVETQAEAAVTQSAQRVRGRVVSNRMDKTITVLVERRIRHPRYGKIITRSTKVHAHDEKNECGEGDIVVVEACRPLSRSKSWRLVEVVERSRA